MVFPINLYQRNTRPPEPDQHTAQMASIPALVEDAAIPLFRNAGRATNSSLEKKVATVIPSVVSRALDKRLPSSAFHSTVKEFVQKCLPEPSSVDVVVAKLINNPPFSVPLGSTVRQEVGKNSLEKTKTEKRFVMLAGAVEEKNIKVKDEIRAERIYTAQMPSPPVGIFDNKVANP